MKALSCSPPTRLLSLHRRLSDVAAPRHGAFLNAQIQGYARIGETFRRDPVGATIRSTASITLLSALLWALNHDDEEYRGLPEWEKKAYWHIPRHRIDGGEGFLRLPKPFELGAVFGTAFEKALDFLAARDPDGWKRLFVDDPERARSVPIEGVKQFAWDTLLALAPTGLMPVMEAGANYWFFGERPIVSDDRLPVEMQYGRYTSETAKFLGKHLQIAPAKIDHMLYGYTGGLGRGIVQAAEAPLTGDRPRARPRARTPHRYVLPSGAWLRLTEPCRLLPPQGADRGTAPWGQAE